MTIDFEALLARSPNSYAVLDTELRLTWVNDAYLQATMRKREDILGRALFDAFPSDPCSNNHKQLENAILGAIRTGEQHDLALIRYDIASPEGVMETRYWSSTTTPLKDHEGVVTHILQHAVDVTELQRLRAMRAEMGLLRRANAVQANNLNLYEQTAQFKALFEQTPGFISVLHGPSHKFRMTNAAFRHLVGDRKFLGLTVAEALPEIEAQGFGVLLDRVWATGEPYVGRRVKVSLQIGPNREMEERFLDFIFQPMLGDDGRIIGIFVQGQNVTEQVEAEERQSLLLNELNHRVKNTLAVVQGLAMQSFRQMPGSDGPRNTFNARLAALARAHDLLTMSNWTTTGFINTITDAVEATIGNDAERFSLSGPDFTLPPQAALSLAMIVHELCTNAVKYGSLSVPDGRITLRWTIDDDGENRHIALHWVESGGPTVTPPSRKGFGSRLIQHGFSSERTSKVEMNYLPTGLECTVTARLPKEVQ